MMTIIHPPVLQKKKEYGAYFQNIEQEKYEFKKENVQKTWNNYIDERLKGSSK